MASTSVTLQNEYEKAMTVVVNHLRILSVRVGGSRSTEDEDAETWLDKFATSLAYWYADGCANDYFSGLDGSAAWLESDIHSNLSSIARQLDLSTDSLNQCILDHKQRSNDTESTLRIDSAAGSLERLQRLVRPVWEYSATLDPSLGPYKDLKRRIDQTYRERVGGSAQKAAATHDAGLESPSSVQVVDKLKGAVAERMKENKGKEPEESSDG